MNVTLDEQFIAKCAPIIKVYIKVRFATIKINSLMWVDTIKG